MTRTILVTGAAGFIGAALSKRLLQRGDRVVGLDNLNDYYDPSLKQARLREIEAGSGGAWRFERWLWKMVKLNALFAEESPCGGESRGPGRCSLFLGKPGGLHPEQFGGLWQCPGRLSSLRDPEPCLCLQQFGLWGQPQFAVS